MRKSPEQETRLREAIKDQLALYPITSIQKLQMGLYKSGFLTSNGTPPDRHYVMRLVKQVHKENLAAVRPELRRERLLRLVEKKRLLTERLMRTVDNIPIFDWSAGKAIYPSHKDRTQAADALMKWELALFYAEEQVNGLETTESTISIDRKGVHLTSRTKTVKSTDEI